MTDWSWQPAATLAERGAGRRGKPAEPSIAASPSLRGRKRLAKWKAQPCFASGALFQQRLDEVGLTEAELLGLLSDPMAAPQASQVEPPPWAAEIASALTEYTSANFSFGAQNSRDPSQLAFLELVRPFIGRALLRLRSGIASLSYSGPGLPFELTEVEGIFLGLLPGRLVPILLRTVVLELNVARLRGLLIGESTEERFASFIARIQWPEVRLEFFREYPVLARQVALALEQWVGCSLEFFHRWCRDWPVIRAEFAAMADPGPLSSIEGGVGDRHRGGRAVWILKCSSGLKIVYKPRPMAVDQHFQDVLGWLNDQGGSLYYQRLKVLDRGDYGWEEFVSPVGCCSREEVARFYERSGGYLALLHALGATDFHHENVLAMGEHPVLLDLEALFHASALEPEARQAGDIAGRSFSESVLGSGLLPVPVWSNRDTEAFDVSGLGADAGKKMRERVPGWEQMGTDQMHFARRQEVLESSSHRPTLNGTITDPVDFLDSMESGFRHVYELLERHGQQWLRPGGILDRFSNDEVRVVLRNTSCYGQLLTEGSHPDVLRDALDRDRLFDRLWEEVSDRPRMAQLIPAEIEDLWRGDVPLFTTRPASHDLWAGAHRRFEGVLNESGLDCAHRRLEHFGPEDLKRQLWFLRASVTTLATRSRKVTGSPRARTVPRGVVGHDELLAAACVIGDRLESTALKGAGDISWIGLSLMREKNWVLAPLGLDFYNGVTGIGFFLAYLGTITGRDRYTALARAAVGTLRDRLRPDQRNKGFSELGAFNGWGGAVYTLAHLGVLWGESALLHQAQEFAEVLPPSIENDKEFDIIGGSAGCLAGLLCLHACKPSNKVLLVAVRCGEHLLAQAQPMPQGLGWKSSFPCHSPLTGFSHGAAGISWALLELAAQTGEERFRTAAVGGIAYERSLFSADVENWPDLRVVDADSKQAQTVPFAVAWCHGAPGIGLARMRCRRLLDDPVFDSEIHAALRTTIAHGFGFNQSLCHGDLGNLDLLLEAARIWPEWSGRTDANHLVAGILHTSSHEGWVCGNPLEVESPGLMTGLAGIGYQLLRCAEPARVPSILSLAPPFPPAVPSTVRPA